MQLNVEEIETITEFHFKRERYLHVVFHHDDVPKRHSFKEFVYLGTTALESQLTFEFIMKDRTATASDIKSLVKDNLEDEKLARACVDRRLDKYIIYNQSQQQDQLKEQIEKFKTEAAEYPFNCIGMINTPTIAADVVRSLLEAILRDNHKNYDTMYKGQPQAISRDNHNIEGQPQE